MKAGFFQFDILKNDTEGNLTRVEDALSDQKFDVMVLPELFTSGYLFESRDAVVRRAEPVPDGETTQRLASLARRKSAFLVGSIPERDGDLLFNTAFLVGPEGYIGKQRKIHLPSLEQQYFSEGTDISTFKVDGITIGILTCFDAWLPELTRILTQQGAQILCHPANFGGTMTLAIMRARSIENHVYSITANRIGGENEGEIEAHFRGESQIIDPEGRVLTIADDTESIKIVDIDPEKASQKKTAIADLHYEWSKYRVVFKNG